MIKSNFFILTGGPGSGKTAVLNELAQRGYLVVPEVARDIIKKQQSIGGNAIHTGDREAFLDLMLEQSIVDYQKMQALKKTVFFDRGIPDLYCYAKAFCKGIPKKIKKEVVSFRSNKTVFIFPPWAEIYKNDAERKQDFTEALKTYDALKEAYLDCGYVLVEIPKIAIVKRANFLIHSLIQTYLNDLKNEINELLGFHDDTPRINYGPCGVFAKLFVDAWNRRFKEKVHIVFVMTKSKEECWHIAVRLPQGELYDGGVGIHQDESYGEDYIIEDMLVYDHALLEKWSYGLDRKYPRFCPNFDKEAVNLLINEHLNRVI